VLLFMIVVCAGVLGGLPHVLSSLAVSIGTRELRLGATQGHVVPLLLGVGVAAALFLLIRFTLTLSAATNPYGLAALAASAGVLAEPAGRRLRRALGTATGPRTGHLVSEVAVVRRC
jgi:hypothetical protein